MQNVTMYLRASNATMTHSIVEPFPYTFLIMGIGFGIPVVLGLVCTSIAVVKDWKK